VEQFRTRFERKALTQKQINQGLGPNDLGIETLLGSDILDNVDQKRLGVALVGVFNEGANQASRLKAVDLLDELLPGANIKSRVVGAQFQDFIPSSLVGRNQFFQTVGKFGVLGAAGGGFAAMGIPGALLGATATSLAFVPRVAGEILVAAGRGQRNIDAMQAFAQAAVFQLASKGINPRNLTLAQVLGRNEELFEEFQPTTNLNQPTGTAVSDTTSPNRTRSFLGNLGRATAGRP
jgi:hypothetical protein